MTSTETPPTPAGAQRRLPVGVEPQSSGAHFRAWAPVATRLDVVLEGGKGVFPLGREPHGYFSGLVSQARPGDRYKLRMDGGEPFPDPVSRFQPEGPHGPSEIVDPQAYAWAATEAAWPGVSIERQVIYEVHVGTFTPEGSFRAAEREFARLRDLGITVLEFMPLAEFSGIVGWGYDGVYLFAPFHHYGTPDDLRHMVEAAHAHGLGVILDVVYNHLGPDGNYLAKYSHDYFKRENTEWGSAINFDGKNSLPVREFFLANVRHWITEYHFDGLRLDATQAIEDDGSHGAHILAEIGATVRAAANGRKTIVLAENEPQDSCLVCPAADNGFGLDAVWNDDFHHSAVVCLTGRREAYYSDHLGRPQEFISAAKYGYLFQGQFYSWQQQPRGTSSLGLNPQQFVTFIENHDQVANFGCGFRMRAMASPARYRAMTALWLLSPGTPMFFQGQEYGSLTPFTYFAGHSGDLAKAVSQGRSEFLLQFSSQDTAEMKLCFSDPENPATFERSRLDPAEQGRYPEILRLHKDLLALRRDDPVISRQAFGLIDGAVLGQHCFVLRYLTQNRQDRLLVVNFGVGLDLPHAPEPLLGPPAGCEWQVLWASEWPRYGGCGSFAPGRFGAWQVPGESAQLLAAHPVVRPSKPEPPKGGKKKTEDAAAE